jgi:citrate/tricarballylate utilization protein
MYYGFPLCFAATDTRIVFHCVLGTQAAYDWYQLPKLLGTLGDIGLLIDSAGLLNTELERDPDLMEKARFGMDTALLAYS